MGDHVALLTRRRPRRADGKAPVVRQVVDALVDGEPIHWDGVDALGTARERTLTRELRKLAWLSTQAITTRAATAPSPRLARAGLLEDVLSAVAGLQLVVALIVLALAPPADSAPIVPEIASGIAPGIGMLSCGAASVALLLRGRRHVPARLLGHVLLLLAALQARPLLDLAAAWSIPPWLRVWWQALFVEAFLPVAMWRFARECPLVVRFTRFDAFSRGVLAAAIGWSVLLASASARASVGWPAPASAVEQWWSSWQRQDASGPFWTALVAWGLVSLVTMAVRAGQAAPAEAQRVRALLWSVGAGLVLLAWAAPPLRGWPSAVTGAVGVPGQGSDPFFLCVSLAWPWLAAMPMLMQAAPVCRRRTWACLAARAPTVLGVVMALALLVPATHLLARGSEPLAHVLADTRVLAALGVAAVAAMLLGAVRLYESRAFLAGRLRGPASGVASVAADVARGRTTREVAAALVRHAQDALDTAVAAVVMPSGTSWVPIVGTLQALPGDSAVAALLMAPGEPNRVGPRSHLFRLLPPEDQAWLRAADVEVIARVAAPDGHTVAGLAIGPRRDGRAYSRRDLAFVSAAVSTAAVAVDAQAARSTRAAGIVDPNDDELAYECGSCGRLARDAGRCACGGARTLAALPARVGGKFVLDRRIGRGGMGVVYAGVDTTLGRPVALKTLPRLLPGAASAMHAEARAMAAVAHPSVAVLYELHVWRDTPVLVVEHLAGGTIATRLAAGAMAAPDAVAVCTVLADALSDLHRRGWLHGDIKPSNIGLGHDGVPKLLDFGLTRLCANARQAVRDQDATAGNEPAWETRVPLAGTPLYMSPEALDGRPSGPDGDVWALSLVLFEMVSGAHPFLAPSLDEVLRRVRRSAPLDVQQWAPAVPRPLARLLEEALHPQRSRRMATASELAAALRIVAAQI